MSLKLRYAFIPHPAVIEASTGQDPHEIDLQLIVSNPAVDPAELESVTIEIPVGDNSARTLSQAPKLPAPTGQLGGWGCTVEASRLRLKPPVQIEEALVLTLPSIKVNEEPGTVPIKITEVANGTPVTDNTTYSLTKVPDSFPITKFWAEPATLSEADEALTLRWEGDASASEYGYRVYTDEGWTAPGTCVSDGRCYTAADGKAGVAGPALIFGSAIHLDVVKTAVPPRVIGTATIFVGIEEPRFSPEVGLERVPSLGGVVACMNWAARHTKQVTLKANGKTLTTDAPADTHSLRAGSLQGYLLTLAAPEAQADFEAQAKLNSGSRYVARTIGILPGLAPMARVPLSELQVASLLFLGGPICAVKRGFNMVIEDDRIVLIDLSDGNSVWSPSGLKDFWPHLALSPDGKLLICGQRREPPQEGFSDCYSLSEPGKPKTSLTNHPYLYPLFSLEDPSRVFFTSGEWSAPGEGTLEIAEAPVGAWDTPKVVGSQKIYAGVPRPYVGSSPGKILAHIGPETIFQPAGGGPLQVYHFPSDNYGSVTPDGSRAAWMDAWGRQIYVADLTTGTEVAIPVHVTRTVLTSQPVALTPDGAFAAVAATAANSILFVDVVNRRQLPGALPAGAPVGVQIGTDGKLAVLESNPPRITIWHATNEATR